ncbi:hypothetical protein K435DRAFT_417182 [Dendrothele bispora CBS 962.96]|uniref:RING-type domain-containing protein n=1 Tax=Dendrothele bispora (strain CBS 962.96) TaxID=1314807 RepID=A0A4S8MUI7_DENBC|nr:hypothetical protein K435DRAFT_417182 [Dendrothele bispora CBS 962.96]
MTYLVLCDICQEDLPLERFLFYRCGHGYCDSCTPKITQRTCPMCRQKRDHEPHRVYLTPAATTVEEKGKALGLALDSIGPESSTKSTRNIGKRIKSFAEEVNVEQATADRLLNVAKEMDERIAPLFFQLQLEQHEKLALQEKVNQWLPRVKNAQKVEREVECLKGHLAEKQKALVHANEVNARQAVAIEKQRQEIDTLKDMISQQMGIISLRDAEVVQWKKNVEDEQMQTRLYKKKLKVLSKGLTQRKGNSDDNDDSLIVGPSSDKKPFTNSRNQARC